MTYVPNAYKNVRFENYSKNGVKCLQYLENYNNITVFRWIWLKWQQWGWKVVAVLAHSTVVSFIAGASC